VRWPWVVNDIHRFSNDHKNVRIVLTSRVVGYQPHRLRNAEFRHFMLQDLDKDQIATFLTRWHEITFDKPAEAEPKRERLAKAIENSKSIAQLAGNPLLLTMMAILNRNQELPRDRVDLYQQCSRLLLHQWDVERTLGEFPGLSAEIGLREKTDILRTVAYAMQTRLSDKSRANFISDTTLTSLIEDYLHTELRFEQPRAVARALVEQLRARNFILCDLGADSYAFVHRTFLEYFCAADIVHQFNVAKTLDIDGLIALFDAHCRDDDWREVLRLICGQIDEQFVGRIVEHLATRTDLEKWDGETPLPELPLAILCVSEVRNVGQVTHPGRLLLHQISIMMEKSGTRGIHKFLSDDVLPASRELGPRWPGRDELASIAFSHAERIGLSQAILVWPVFVSVVWEDRKAVEKLAKVTGDTGWNHYCRLAALQALAEKWPDETTLKVLKDRAASDESDWVKQVAERLAKELEEKLQT
jgi:hypothetical protein